MFIRMTTFVHKLHENNQLRSTILQVIYNLYVTEEIFLIFSVKSSNLKFQIIWKENAKSRQNIMRKQKKIGIKGTLCSLNFLTYISNCE
jgi:hypothetical protein